MLLFLYVVLLVNLFLSVPVLAIVVHGVGGLAAAAAVVVCSPSAPDVAVCGTATPAAVFGAGAPALDVFIATTPDTECLCSAASAVWGASVHAFVI